MQQKYKKYHYLKRTFHQNFFSDKLLTLIHIVCILQQDCIDLIFPYLQRSTELVIFLQICHNENDEFLTHYFHG